MPNLTTNYNFNLPLVNDPVDEDLWGGQLNANWTSLDSILPATSANEAGALVVQNAADDGFDTLSAQGTSGQPLLSQGADANPAFGTLGIAAGGTGQTTASAAFNALKQNATTSATGVVELATAAEMEAASSTTVVPTPSVVINHPGVAKAWASIDQTGTQTIQEDFGIASISDLGVGRTRFTLDNTMASSTYSVVAMASDTPVLGANTMIEARTTTTFDVRVHITATGDTDVDVLMVAVYGDLA